jgi:hypothetical protein
MSERIPELNKQPGVFYAWTNELFCYLTCLKLMMIRFLLHSAKVSK